MLLALELAIAVAGATPDPVAMLYGNRLAAVRYAERVEVFRLKPGATTPGALRDLVDPTADSKAALAEALAPSPTTGEAGTSSQLAKRIDGNLVTSESGPLDVKAAETFRKLLTDSGLTAPWRSLPPGHGLLIIKGCGEFEAAAAVRFYAKGRVATALLCFKCEDVRVVESGTKVPMGKLARGLLVALLGVFPADQDLKAKLAQMDARGGGD